MVKYLLYLMMLGLIMLPALADTSITGQAAGGVSVSETARPVGSLTGNLTSHGEYLETSLTLSGDSYLTRPSFFVGGDVGLLPESVWQFGLKGQLRSGYFFGYDKQIVMDWRVAPHLVWQPGSALSVEGEIDVSPHGLAPRLESHWNFFDQTALHMATWYEVHSRRYSAQGGLVGRLTNTLSLDLRPGVSLNSEGTVFIGSFRVVQQVESTLMEPQAMERHWQYRLGLIRWIDPWDDQLRTAFDASAQTPLVFERFSLTGFGKAQVQPRGWYQGKLELSYRLPSRWQLLLLGERTWRPNPTDPHTTRLMAGLAYSPPDK